MRAVMVALLATLALALPAAGQQRDVEEPGDGQAVYRYGSTTIYCTTTDPETNAFRIVDCPAPEGVNLLTFPAPDPADYAVSVEDWEQHKDDATDAYGVVIDKAKYRTAKQLKQGARAKVKWYQAEMGWLQSNMADPCYADNWDAWWAAVAEMGAGITNIERGHRVKNSAFVNAGLARASAGWTALLAADTDSSAACATQDAR